MKLPNFTRLLYGVSKPTQKCLFLNLNTVLSDSTPEKFPNIWQMKWNWIRWIRLKRANSLLKCIFGLCCHPEILLPWKRDVTTSPLYIEHLVRIIIKFRWGQHFRTIFFQSWWAFFNLLNFLQRSCHYWRIEFKAMMASCRSFKRWIRGTQRQFSEKYLFGRQFDI